MQAELKKSEQILKDGKLLLYPTDTVWGIGCDATNPDAVQKVYNLKQRDDSKALICLVSSVEMLKDYVDYVPAEAVDIILKNTKKPTTIIYYANEKLAQNLLAEDNSVAVRVSQSEFCQRLINNFGKPIISTSANISGVSTPQNYNEIQPEILKGVDYVVNLQKSKKNAQPSQILKIDKSGQIHVIRP
ncbi:L-threonylcarbamoyladenylate synthase [Psychroflexus halocasei]|uniref:L-threonylcarbamoyladenylate synthase n=1 Tax=Psychroflexus halocasei TaxID=908615 RepID=A0A1H3X584_9FLAO|nr:L-threonylcarbamoyladenylate synthase [Psychroflexus halocasei]SDZ94569.1 L-threonylcarbamoyladenylate synthase [Psychroflexus halocasei]